jgi:hypothetical protein
MLREKIVRNAGESEEKYPCNLAYHCLIIPFMALSLIPLAFKQKLFSDD